MAKPITKAAWQINDPGQVPHVMQASIFFGYIGTPWSCVGGYSDGYSGRRDQCCHSYCANCGGITNAAIKGLIEDILNQLSVAQRPMVLVGGGIVLPMQYTYYVSLLILFKSPSSNSLLAVDALPYQHPLRIGLLGTYGNRWANLAMGRTDLLLVLGSRLDIRQTGSDVASFKADRVVYHVDIEEGEINNRLKGCKPVISHLHSFLTTLIGFVSKRHWTERRDWVSEIQDLRKKWPDTR